MSTAPIDSSAPQYIYRPPQPPVDNSQTASQSNVSTQRTTQTQTTTAPKAASQSSEVQDQAPPPPPPPTVNTNGQQIGTTLSTTA
ncbi:hypothetical protein [Undibacterium sp.]|uniref:hypothetical protein n=1 Tax=Undibacterium sp. TaxID=1914977 RepID=UPI00374D766B